MTLTTLPRFKSQTGIAYHKTGTGPPVLFLHGVGLRAESWTPQIAFLKSRFTIYALDLPGHGDSQLLPVTKPDINIYTDIIKEFIHSEIKAPVTIIGHSLGALISLDLLAEKTQLCTKVCALSTIYNRPPTALAAVQARAAYIQENPDQDLAHGPLVRWFGHAPKGDDKTLAAWCREMITGNNPKGYAAAYYAFAHTTGADQQSISQASVPVLFITGDQDANSTPEMSKSLCKTTPQGTLCLIKGAKHMVQLSHPEPTNLALENFLLKTYPQEK